MSPPPAAARQPDAVFVRHVVPTIRRKLRSLSGSGNSVLLDYTLRLNITPMVADFFSGGMLWSSFTSDIHGDLIYNQGTRYMVEGAEATPINITCKDCAVPAILANVTLSVKCGSVQALEQYLAANNTPSRILSDTTIKYYQVSSFQMEAAASNAGKLASRCGIGRAGSLPTEHIIGICGAVVFAAVATATFARFLWVRSHLQNIGPDVGSGRPIGTAAAMSSAGMHTSTAHPPPGCSPLPGGNGAGTGPLPQPPTDNQPAATDSVQDPYSRAAAALQAELSVVGLQPGAPGAGTSSDPVSDGAVTYHKGWGSHSGAWRSVT